MPVSIPQSYPRIQDQNSTEYGCLDVTQLVDHTLKISPVQLEKMIENAIKKANKKSSRESIKIPQTANENEIQRIYAKAGKGLFSYFKKYCGDPASTAHQVHQKHYRQVGLEQFRNRVVQKGRMNSGWRYQFLLLDCAIKSRRFQSVSDIGAAEADFNVVVEYKEKKNAPLSLYVSIKNRRNTMGGQDWPKAIHALETVAKNDKNRTGPYCCVFGIAMDRGQRYIKIEQKTRQPHSVNTEIWLSDFLWPFFTNYSYQEIMSFVLEVLLRQQDSEMLSMEVDVPDEVLESFGRECQKAGLIDESGFFNDPHKLVYFFTSVRL